MKEILVNEIVCNSKAMNIIDIASNIQKMCETLATFIDSAVMEETFNDNIRFLNEYDFSIINKAIGLLPEDKIEHAKDIYYKTIYSAAKYLDDELESVLNQLSGSIDSLYKFDNISVRHAINEIKPICDKVSTLKFRLVTAINEILYEHSIEYIISGFDLLIYNITDHSRDRNNRRMIFKFITSLRNVCTYILKVLTITI